MSNATDRGPRPGAGLRAATLLLCTVPTAACGGSEATARETIGDTLVVTSVAPLIADTLRPVEVTRYGRFDGPPEHQFADIHSFAVGPDGHVYVHDRNGGIRRFDAAGQFVERVAGPGEGPADVDYVIAMDVARDGRLAVYDYGNAVIKLFDGGDVTTVRRPDGYPRYRGGGLRFHEDGTLWVGVTPPFPEEGGIRHPRAAFTRLAGGGDFVDTVYTPRRLGDDCSTLTDYAHVAGFWEDNREPYVPKAKWALGADGRLVIGCPRRYAFDVLLDGGRVLRVVRPWTPVELSAEEKALHERYGRTGPLPDLRPAYASIVLPDDGRIWVWPTHPNVREALPRETVERYGVTHTWTIAWQGTFDVFDPDGRWRAVVRLPEDARYSGYPTEPDVVIRGDTLWAVATDDFDVEYVVRYEVRGLSDER